jgi:hypothetical protein
MKATNGDIRPTSDLIEAMATAIADSRGDWSDPIKQEYLDDAEAALDGLRDELALSIPFDSWPHSEI